jgi:hypothetical protein
MEELQIIIGLRQSVEINQWLVLNMKISAGALWVTCARWMRGLLEISEWLDDLHYLICCEFNPYLYEIYNGRWHWDAAPRTIGASR